MDGYLVFDTVKGRMISVYHTKTHEAALEARAEIKAMGVGNAFWILHLDTVLSWEETRAEK